MMTKEVNEWIRRVETGNYSPGKLWKNLRKLQNI